MNMRRTNRHPDRPETPSFGGLSNPQVVALAAAFLIAVVLSPVGAQAAQTVSAIITDPDGTNQATVDADGDLQVGGTVGIDSSSPVATTSADDPGRMAFQEGGSLSFVPGQARAQFAIVVPEGKRLVITHVSGDVLLPPGQRPIEISLVVSAGGLITHSFVPTFTGTTTFLTDSDVFAFSQDTTIYANGQVNIAVDRNGAVGSASGRAAISGYLIDCSVAPCN